MDYDEIINYVFIIKNIAIPTYIKKSGYILRIIL